MNNFYVLHHLIKEMHETCTGFSFKFSVSPHKNVWEGYLEDDYKKYRLIFSANRSETTLFLDQFRASGNSNITTFFNELTNRKIISIELAANDRYISIHFSDGYILLFQVFGNKPNIFLIRENVIRESFKSPGVFTGTIPPEPRTGRASSSKPDASLIPKKQILAIDPKFPRHLIPKMIEEYNLDKKKPDEIQSLIHTSVSAMLETPQFRILDDGNLCLLPQHILPAENLEVFEDVNSAVRFAYYKTSGERRFSARLQSIKPKIESRILKLESLMAQLQQADKGLERAETYEQYGHILMAHAHISIDGELQVLELPNYYNNDEPVDIPIERGLTIAENAQKYYEKSAKAIRNVEESVKRVEETGSQLADLKTMERSLNKITKSYEFDNWLKEHKNKLLSLSVLTSKTGGMSTPYRKLQLDGYDIWLGRNAKSNDKLTTDAHKEDVWMHARGVSGSHLVIRMNNQKEMPPKSVLLKAAAIAAWNSKARGAGLVPVSITKRKYVTKPRGAPPGTVRLQQEGVEMVEPAEFKG